MKKSYNLAFILWIILSFPAMAQNSSSVIEEQVFSDKIKTIILAPVGADMSLPVLNLGTKEKLLLQFDELDGQFAPYRYKIQHCTAEWEPSELKLSQYLDGFDSYPITNKQYSFNTIQRYVNYYETIPDDMSKLKVSGNYILIVYSEDDEDNPVFTKRFMVKEEGMGVIGEVKVSSNVEFRRQQQELQLSVTPMSSFYFAEPKEYVKVYAQQNNRRDQTRKMKLYSVRGNTYDYIWAPENFFNGGNEFRVVDIKNIKIRSRFVEKIEFLEGATQIYLLPEKDKSKLSYSYDDDINGKFKIHAENPINSGNPANSNTEGDYGWVHFILPASAPRLDGGFYIVGQLTDWYLNDNSKMTYLEQYNAYIAALYLKQGYYNYQVLFKAVNSTIGDESALEGNHVETENDYVIYVYYRRPGDIYDRLVGLTTINSRTSMKNDE